MASALLLADPSEREVLAAPGLRPGWFADAERLAVRGDAPALITDRQVMTYRQLADRVADAGDRLGGGRQLVLLSATKSLPALVNYLGALHAGHVPLMIPPGAPAREVVECFRPTVAVGPDTGWKPQRLQSRAVPLHPELALLMSTSGSTGSPKLVRLSAENLMSNAAAITDYLGIEATDRAPTTLPPSYCYGLSVINSHLFAGASLLVTDQSVTDEGFWELMRRHQGTSLAGVPYTFELLERIGFADRSLPSLRYLTQAGGRMDSDRVRRFARLGGDRGWELFVMYGQTEATARMAYLPPELALTRPTCVGRAIPGGRFRLIGSEEIEESGQSADWGIGELVYGGPNVMLGYATELADLARGRDVEELRTGDLARIDSAGLIEIVGRLGRTAKVQGLRIDLGRLENRLESEGFGVHAVQAGTHLGLVGAYEGHREPTLVSLAGEFTGLARSSVLCRRVDQVPRLSSGKPDYRALAQVAVESRSASEGGAERAGGGVLEAELVELFAQLLGRTEANPTSSFVSLGGDSLSFVAVCAALEGRVGALPRNWPQLSIRELALLPGPATRPGARPIRQPSSRANRRSARWPRRRVETSTLLRAIAIVAVVGSHIGVFDLRGGAQMLFAIVGYNFARFHLTSAGRIERLNRATRALGRVLVPALLWLLPLMLFTSQYSPSVLMVNNLFGPDFGDAPEWRYWFIEAMVYILIAVVVVLAVPVVDRWERRNPFALPLMMLGVGVGMAAMTEPGTPGGTRSPLAVFWVFALGWALGKATSGRQRMVVILLAVALAPWLIGQADRMLFLVGGLALLGCLAFVPVPRFVAWTLIELAGASLIIYLTHWQVYPLMVGGERAESAAEGWPALVISMAFGVMAWRLASRVMVGLKGQPVNSARCLHKMITKRVSESILLTPTR